MTEWRQIDHTASDEPATRAVLALAAAAIRMGRLVAFPTETVYGLGANALDARAVHAIYTAKQRDLADPCIVHIASLHDLPRVAALPLPTGLAELAAAFWPGPLSLIVPRAATIPDIVTAGRATVAVRLPSHPVALALVRCAGVPIAAPSANRFMHTSPTTAQHVWDDLHERIDLILDAGPTTVGIESTVLDLTTNPATLRRPGGVSREQLEAVLGPIQVATHADNPDSAASPGLLAMHYAPTMPFILYDGPPAATLAAITAHAQRMLTDGQRVGLLLTSPDAATLATMVPVTAAIVIEHLGQDTRTVAQHLYASMRALEDAKVAAILSRTILGQGLAEAVNDRLLRAAGSRIHRVG